MKKAFIKRALLIATAGVMASSLIACKKDQAKETTTPTTPTAEKVVEKPTSINIMTDIFMTEEAGRAEFLEVFKEKSGIELKLTQPAHNQYYEKVNLAFASGDLPDVVEMGGTPFLNYAANGALYDMTELIEKSNFIKNVDMKYMDAIRVNGKMYLVPNGLGGGTVTYARGDWMEANKIKEPTNYNEFIEMLKVFADDPDKNGKKDTIAYTAPGLINVETPFDIYLREFYQNDRPDFFIKDGKWVDGMMQPSIKNALQRMKDAYALGLIDTEIVTNKTSTCRDKFYAGKVGTFNYWAGGWNKNLDTNLQKTVPTGYVTPLKGIKETKYIERLPIGLVMTNKAKNPEGIFKYFFEYIHDSGEGQMLFTHGVEGMHYEVKDGKYIQLPGKQDPNVLFGKTYFSPELSITKWNDPFELDPRIPKSLGILSSNSFLPDMLPASEAYTRASGDLLQVRTEVISKAVMGQMSIDEALAQYSKQAKSMSDEIVAELNKLSGK